MAGFIEPNVFLSSLRFMDFDTKIRNSGRSRNKLGVRKNKMEVLSFIWYSLEHGDINYTCAMFYDIFSAP